MDENTFKIGVNPEATAQTATASPAPTTTVSTTQAVPSSVTTSQAANPTALQAAPASATPPPAPLASSAPQPTSPVINTKLNVQLDKSVDTQLGRLGGAESKLLSTKSYLIIGILIIALATISYGTYVFFFAAESATEESFEDITLTNKLGGTEDSAETISPPSLTINLPEETTADTPTDVVDDTNTPAYTPTNSKIPR